MSCGELERVWRASCTLSFRMFSPRLQLLLLSALLGLASCELNPQPDLPSRGLTGDPSTTGGSTSIAGGGGIDLGPTGGTNITTPNPGSAGSGGNPSDPVDSPGIGGASGEAEGGAPSANGGGEAAGGEASAGEGGTAGEGGAG
jgi:hypothetical protein